MLDFSEPTPEGKSNRHRVPREVREKICSWRRSTFCAGVFLFAPFLAQFDIPAVVRAAGLPGSKSIPAVSYLLSFLALKLAGDERYAHLSEHAFDPGLGLFAGLNVLPKCTAMSPYSFGLDEVHITQLQSAFVKQATQLGLYGGPVVNLDFHPVPHFGEEPRKN